MRTGGYKGTLDYTGTRSSDINTLLAQNLKRLLHDKFSIYNIQNFQEKELGLFNKNNFFLYDVK